MKRLISALSSLCLAASTLLGSVPGISASAARVKAEDTIVYNLVPQDKQYTAAADDATGNNTMSANPGEEIIVDWTVKNDQGTAGLQMSFDFSGVTYVEAENGTAYRGTPQFNDTKAATTGEINYAYASNNERTAADDAVIYSFTVKAPESGSATIGMKTGSGINNKVVPAEDGEKHDFLFHGLTINVGGSAGTTGTTGTTPGSQVDTTNKIIYNLVPQDKQFTAVADNTTGNNTMSAAAGEEIIVDWTVKNDQGTAGIQMSFDFSGVTYVEAENGTAYRGTPQFNDTKTATTGEINYAYATNTERTAADDAVIYSFTIKAPASGSATIGMKTGSGINNKVVPAEDGKQHDFLFHGLTINVGGSAGTTGTTATTPGSQVDTTNKIIYNLVPQDKQFTAVADNMTGNNTMTASAGEEIIVDWTVKNDQGTAGLQMSFDFSGVTYVEAENGTAYRGTPQFNDTKAATTGEINYAYASNNERTAADDAVIYSFTIKAPESGSATIGMKTGSGINNKVVPAEDGEKHDFLFHGLTINVGGSAGTTGTTSGSQVDTTNKIIYNLVPQGKDYTAVADDKTGNNTMNATAGEEIIVDWTVKNDQGTAGIQMSFDFSGVTYVEAENGTAYRGTPQFNDTKAATTGEINYAYASNTERTAADDAVIYSFTIKAPESGSATIGMKTGSDITNKVVPAEDGKEHQILFHGLVINVVKEDTTTTTVTTTTEPTTKPSETTANVPAGSANWTIGKETAAAGADVKVPVTVSGDAGTAGFVVEFAYDSALKYNGITWADGYTGEATINKNESVVVWADANGEDQKAADNAVVMYINFTAPSAAGTYDVTFKDLQVTNTAGNALTLTKTNGSVTVVGDAGSANWKIGNETVAAGAKVKVPVTVSGDEGTSGIVAEFTADSALTFEGIEWADGYTGNATLNDKELVAVWADANGADQKAADDAVVLYLNFTAPTTAGEYPVEFKSLEVCNADGAWLALTKENGSVIVTDPNAGSATWIIGEEVVDAGAQVKVPVTVTGDTGTAGFIAEFAYDSNLTYTGIEWAKGYTGTATINLQEMVLVWADANGANQKAEAGAVVAYLLFTAPDKPGEYPVTFKELAASNEDGGFLALTKQDGMVIVKDPNAGSANWIIGKEQTTAGATVKVPVTVKGDTGTAGFNVEFAYDQNLTFTGFEWAGEAYTGKATINMNDQIVVWADANGENQKAADDAKILYLVFTAPDETGIYPVRFIDLDTSDTNGVALVVEKEDGYVEVVEVTTTTTTETTSGTTTTVTSTTASDVTTTVTSTTASDVTTTVTSTTASDVTTTVTSTTASGETTTVTSTTVSGSGVTSTSASVSTSGSGSATTNVTSVTSDTTTTPIPNPGHVVYQIAKVEGMAGTTVSVPVYAWYDEGTAGFTMQFAVPNGLKISGVQYGDAYTGANSEFSWNAAENVLVWASPDGANQTAAAGAVIVYLLVDVPAGAPAGIEYPVTFVKEGVSISDTDGKELEYQLIDGSIKIVEKLTDTTTVSQDTTTVSTTVTASDVTSTSSASVTTVTTSDNVTTVTTTTSDDVTAVTTTTSDDVTAVTTTTSGDVTSETTTTSDDVTSETTTTSGDVTSETTTTSGDVTSETTTTSGDVTSETTTTSGDVTSETTTTSGDVTSETTTTSGDVTSETTTTSDDVTSETTTTSGDVTSETTTTSGDVTSETTTTTLKVVTSYSISFEPPTRVNYWSHDTRSFKESNGLKDLSASLTIFKFYVNDEGYFVDENGTVLSAKYDAATGAIPTDVKPFQEKTLDATAFTHPLESEDGPKKVWENEIKAQFGENYTAEQELSAKHANKYPVKAYYFPSEQTDPDFNINNGEPVEFGEFQIYIGVKGDVNLDNVVSAEDPTLVLIYYTNKIVAQLSSDVLINNEPKVDPEFEGEDRLCYYLGDVAFKNADGTLTTPTLLGIEDAQYILIYYTEKYVALKDDTTWEYVVGYDLLDSFYGGVEEG